MRDQTELYRILIVESVPEAIRSIRAQLTDLNLDCVTARNIQEAIELIQNNSLDIILTNQKISDGDGFAILQIAIEADPDIPVVIYTVEGSIFSAVKAIKKGAFEYILQSLLPESM